METSVARLFIHGPKSTRPDDVAPTPMAAVGSVEAVEGMGLREDARYFRRTTDAHDRKRQVSLIDEATVWDLERSFGPIPPEFIKAQIVLSGEIHLPSLVGSRLRFEGGSELRISIPRIPCYAMDLIHSGLRLAMEGGRQGALARVTVSGPIVVGQTVSLEASELTSLTA